jgi:hypothetical protein
LSQARGRRIPEYGVRGIDGQTSSHQGLTFGCSEHAAPPRAGVTGLIEDVAKPSCS